MRADRAPAGAALIEREREHQAIAELVDSASTGRGGVLLIEGVAGIGKTRLLRETATQGGEAGALVLQARGSELEQDFAFGVIRQLFEPLVRAAGPRGARLFRGSAELARGALSGKPLATTSLSGSGAMFAVFLGLYWLVANLCDDAPLLLLFDDLQWADAASQLFLAFLGGRLSGLSVGIAASLRSGAGNRPAALVELADLSMAVAVRPDPLSRNGVAVLVEDMLGAPSDGSFVDACVAATGGVPFYVCELLRELAREGVEPIAAGILRIADVHPPAVVQSVLGRIARVSEDAISIARAIAVLGDGADDEQVVRLSDARADSLSGVLLSLRQTGVLAAGMLGFAHPIIQKSVYEDIPARERAELHRRAATVILDRGGDVERVAAHLLRARPAGDARTVEQLEDAAARALARGGTTEAVAMLHRALAEPPAPDHRGRVLFELGCAEQRAGALNHAVEHLRAATESGRAAPWWGEAALALAQALFTTGQVDDAMHLVDTAADELEQQDPELSRRLRLAFLLYGRIAVSEQLDDVLDRVPALRLQVGANTPAARLLNGMLCAARLMANEPAADIGPAARDAWGDGDLLVTEPPDSVYHFPLIGALICTGEHDAALAAVKTLLFESRKAGSGAGMAMGRTLGALAGLRHGALLDAEADAVAALALTGDHFVVALPMALGLAVEVFVERGDLATAEALIADHPIPQSLALPGFYEYYLGGRASLHLAQGRSANALDDLRLVGRRLLATQAPSPAVYPWRSRAAIAADRLGEGAEAGRLAREEIELAEAFGCPHTRSVALRAAGLVIGGPEGQALAERAVAAVDHGPFELEAARANTTLGQMLRRRGSLGAARDRLRRGLELAVRCGAGPIADLARTELVAAGGRPRRWAVSGVDALTATEHRICSLASAGLSNREIAQELFVVVKTVEVHLTTSYRKLGIGSRLALKRMML